MKINFVYNSLNPQISISELFKDIENVKVFDMSYTKEAKKGRVVLNKYAASELPFMEFVDEEDNMLYVSYGEINKIITREDVLELIKIYNK